MNIIAIGGGSLKKKETLDIDRQIVKQAGRHSPKALFIPTASGDPEEYCETFDRIYGELLGCKTEHLLLFRRPEDRRCAAEKIKAADLIYVGGGNTLRMMKFWRQLGVDKLLIRAASAGTVMAGLSAGAICWFDWGHSDSRAYSGRKKWSYIKVRALGLCSGIYCPHLDGEKRHASFKAMIEQENRVGIACDNKAAVWYHDKGVTCITSSSKAAVHVYTPKAGSVRISTFRNGGPIDFGG